MPRAAVSSAPALRPRTAIMPLWPFLCPKRRHCHFREPPARRWYRCPTWSSHAIRRASDSAGDSIVCAWKLAVARRRLWRLTAGWRAASWSARKLLYKRRAPAKSSRCCPCPMLRRAPPRASSRTCAAPASSAPSRRPTSSQNSRPLPKRRSLSSLRWRAMRRAAQTCRYKSAARRCASRCAARPSSLSRCSARILRSSVSSTHVTRADSPPRTPPPPRPSAPSARVARAAEAAPTRAQPPPRPHTSCGTFSACSSDMRP